MTRMPKALAALALAGLLGLGSTTAAVAAPAQAELIEATPESVSFQAPAPGASEGWDMSVRNLTSTELPLTVTVSGDSDGLYEGATPLTLELRSVDTGEVVFAGDVADALGTTIALPALAGGGTQSYEGTVSLPGAAGNEYQGLGGWLELDVVAMADDGTTPVTPQPGTIPGLPSTGTELGVLAIVLASLAVLVGTGIVIARRRSRA